MADADHDTWVVCRHRFARTGQSAVITVNSTLEKRLRFADYPFHVSVAVEAAPGTSDASGRIGAHESRHLVHLTRVIRRHLEREDQHLIAIVHGAGARTLVLHAKDGESVAARLGALKLENTWDRAWTFEVARDAEGRLSEQWRDIARAGEDHHLAIDVPQSADGEAADHHHHLF